MRKLLVTLDEEIDPWLAQFTNQNEVVRDALRVYKENISPGVIDTLRTTYLGVRGELEKLNERQEVMNQNLEAIAKKAGTDYKKDEFSEFGA